MKTKDNSKSHPEGITTEKLRSLFVTGMEDDVLKYNDDDF